ncbi:MAG: class I SAM-dependent methyltransferase [Phycisphaerae bacterium]
MEFTSHNIQLPDGSRTMAEKWLLNEGHHCKAIMRTLNLVFPPTDRNGLRIVDLGCLEGGYAVEFARAGFDVLGIEARKDNINKCEYVADKVGLRNLSFVQNDVRNLAKYGTFDAVFCCGLLYHLENPAAYLKLIGRCTRRLLILQTHYATEPDPPNFKLSPMTTHEGHRSKWFVEWPAGSPPEQVEHWVWASVGNDRSFWPTKKHLLQSVREAGFQIVYEQYDFLDNIVDDPYIEQNARSLFIGIR